MADKNLAAREAALIAQARAQLQQKAAVKTEAGALEPCAPAGAPQAQDPTQSHEAASRVKPELDLAAAQRLAALIAAAGAETERARRRQKLLYVWVPFAFMVATGMWTLLWMWNKL